MRNVLVAFAAGSVVTSGAWLLGHSLAFQKDGIPVVEVSSREQALDDIVNKSEEDTAIRTSSSGFVRRCGATEFTAEMEHNSPRSRIQITRENEEVIDCILANAPKEGFPLYISFKAD